MSRILVIDDERMIRKMLQKHLTLQGYKVFTAENGETGLILFEENQPEVILLDLKMPKMGGLDFLKQLRPQIHNFYSVIILTGFETDHDLKTCYELGIQSFLRKPVNLLELNGVVKRTFDLIHFSAELKKEIEEKERAYFLLKQTFDGMAEGVITLDNHLGVLMISRKACQMLKVSEQETLNKPAASVLGAPVAGPSGELAKCLKTKTGVSEIRTKLLCASGAILPVSLSIIPLSNPYSKANWILFFRDSREEERQLQALSKGVAFGQMISCDSEMKEIFNLIDKVALSNATVLLQGETGSGKELAAREIHERSRRAQKPFHAVNCAAISPNLLESEFFGHERGAFTGANQAKPGRFELADQGTLFLDEIGEIPLELQVKLLRALQEQSFERVGGTKSIHVDVRLIAATNRDLKEMIRTKQFREDLFYRLDVVSINLPPLRKRPQDISLLVTSFIETLNQKEERHVKQIAPNMLEQLLHYSWPGNVRELFHVIEYAFAVSDGTNLKKEHLPEKLLENGQPAPVDESPPRSEREAILKALEQTNFHKSKAAALLGVSYVTFYRKCKKYQI